MSVLIIEDSKDLQTFMKLAVEARGHTVSVAENGKEGLEILRSRNDIEVVILDLMMPVMDGWEFTRIRKADPVLSNIPVVICSAAKSDIPVTEGFLQKPVSVKKLLDEISKFHLPPQGN